ncbi:QRFP-like peptide receptor isoform X2 [Ostrea edulis]|uniref:QRFP-like peptide receptor isoform X2 n=1 Tax=Ostrea edulis TaxID=37623 RepID=UPI0024AEFBC3|nr:QRFP-like peptide receptor isoform X2 [Ostrea edulis]
MVDLNETFNFSDFDTRHHDYPLSMLTPVPVGEAAVKITIYTLLILIALIGNTLIILVVLKNKRMQTTTNYFLVNLAVSDLVVSLSCSWVHLVDDLTEGWVLGAFFCSFNSFAQVASLISSILSLTLVACDRFFGIVYAMKAHIIERKAKPVIIAIWVISVAVAIPMLIFRRVQERHWKNHVERWCDDVEWSIDLDSEETHYHRASRVAYWTCVSVILFFLPIIAMIGAYCGIIKTLWSTKIPGERVYKENAVQTKMKRKVIVMLIVILAVFAICWCPIQITLLYSEYRDHTKRVDVQWMEWSVLKSLRLLVEMCDQDSNQIYTLSKMSKFKLEEWYSHLEFSARLLAFSNSAFNPLIYAGFNENFRKELTAIIFLKKALSVQRRKRYIPRNDTRRSTTTVTFHAVQAEDVL